MSLDATKRFQIEYIPRRALVFNYGTCADDLGDPGDKYYIVVTGQIDLWIPIMNNETKKM